MKLTPYFKKIFLISFVFLFLTGAVWWYLDVWVRVQGPLGEDHHPVQNVLSRTHGVIAYFFLLLLGYLLHAHVRPGLKSKKKRNLKNGWFMIVLVSMLVISSVMDLFGPENKVREVLALLHRYGGAVFPLYLLIHIWNGKRKINEIR